MGTTMILVRNIVLCCCLSITWAIAVADTLEGKTFDPVIRVADRQLRLSGLGVRSILFFKVYVAGLYLDQKVGTAKGVAAIPGPKRLQLRMLRRAGSDDFNQALVDGIRDNTSEDELKLLEARVAQLTGLIKSVGNIVDDDVVDIDYIPEHGTTLAVNGSVKGPAIAGVDFYNAVLAIFVGDHPVDARLKRGLLGQ